MKSKMVFAALAVIGAASMWGLTAMQPERPQVARVAPQPQPGHGPVVSVSATGRVSAAPDRVTVWIGKTAEAEQAADAIAQVNSTMNELIDQLKRLRLEGAMIQTASVQVWPQYLHDSNARQPRISGYQASNTLTVRFDEVARVGDVFDLAAGAGANQINGPSFSLRDADAATRAALREAVAEGKRKAEAIAEEMGMTVIRWEEIRESGTDMPRPMYAADMMTTRGVESATPVESGEIDTTATITLVARLGAGNENADPHPDRDHGEHD